MCARVGLIIMTVAQLPLGIPYTRQRHDNNNDDHDNDDGGATQRLYHPLNEANTK